MNSMCVHAALSDTELLTMIGQGAQMLTALTLLNRYTDKNETLDMIGPFTL
jgi:hypothetical protein